MSGPNSPQLRRVRVRANPGGAPTVLAQGVRPGQRGLRRLGRRRRRMPGIARPADREPAPCSCHIEYYECRQRETQFPFALRFTMWEGRTPCEDGNGVPDAVSLIVDPHREPHTPSLRRLNSCLCSEIAVVDFLGDKLFQPTNVPLLLLFDLLPELD